MYNDRKLKFIEDYRSTNTCVSINFLPKLKLIEPYEEQYGKDLSEFTVDEILDYYRMLCTPSLEYLLSTNSWFSIYTKWCLAQHLVPDCQNHYAELDKDIIYTCINKGLTNQMIVNREDLIDLIETLDNPSDKFLALALFEGICGKHFMDLHYLTLENFNGNKVTLHSGKEIIVSDELKRYAMQSANEYVYYCFSYSVEQMRSNERKLDNDDNSIIKKMYNSKQNPSEIAIFQRINNRLNRIKDHFSMPCFCTKGLMESGRIHMIEGLLRSGNYDSVFDCILKNKKEIDYRYGTIASINRYLLKYGEYIGRG